MEIKKIPLTGTLAEHLGGGAGPASPTDSAAPSAGPADASPGSGGASLVWLGQAGFVLRDGNGGQPGTMAVIDPYLSDYLAEKYAGAEFPHTRMMRPPVSPEELVGADAVFCTHAHSDHMDPKTLPGLAAANPRCTFIVPAAVRGEAETRGAPADRILALDAGNTAELPGDAGTDRSGHTVPAGLTVRAVPAAHETLETDDAGRHRFLGYIIGIGGIRFYHSGDGIPYEGLEEWIGRGQVDIALLPVNGRDAYRRERGVPGNFTVEEALEICEVLDIPVLIPHHFGMFDFNTVDPKDIVRICNRKPRAAAVTVPEAGFEYRFKKT